LDWTMRLTLRRATKHLLEAVVAETLTAAA
jgi:hypothetical protein